MYTIFYPYRIILEEDMAPLILDKEEDGDDADDHGAGDADDDYEATVHDILCVSCDS